MSFIELLTKAKLFKEYEIELIKMYSPLLGKESVVNGIYDEDLYQELVLVLLRCIKTFKI